MTEQREKLRARIVGEISECMPGADGEADAQTITDALMPLFAETWAAGARAQFLYGNHSIPNQYKPNPLA